MAKLEIPIVIDEQKLHEIIKKQFVKKDKVEAALLEIIEDVEPKCINDRSDKYGSISHYQRGLYDAAQILLKHVGEDLKQ